LKDIGLVALYPSATATGDLTRLRQILLNLTGNAVKFTDKGDVVIQAEITTGSNGASALRFTVTDTGIGISSTARQRLFQDFSQGDPSITRRFGGTGLGLAISARLVTAMGGAIGVESEAGQGSQFWFTVPIDCRVDDADALDMVPTSDLKINAATPLSQDMIEKAFVGAPQSGSSSVGEPDRSQLLLVDARCLKGSTVSEEGLRHAIVYGAHASIYAGIARAVVDGPLTRQRLSAALAATTPDDSEIPTKTPVAERYRGIILLVEDNAINQRVATGLLEKMGLTVEIAGDGVQAVERAAKGGIDLILMDMQMPRMDGLEATGRIRSLEGAVSQVPIVGLTANAFASDRDDCLRAGMNGFSTKPINREKLHEIMREWLSSNRLPQSEEAAKPLSQTQMIVALAEAVGVAPHPQAEPDTDVVTQEPTESLIDHVQQRVLVEELGQETLDQLTASFWRDLETLLASAEDPTADAKTIRRVLHTIKGTAESVGFRGVAIACEEVKETHLSTGTLSTGPIRTMAQRIHDVSGNAAHGLQKAA
jgi:CheY-like chemotaxis protein